MENTKKLKNNTILMCTFKGSLIATMVSLVCILFFAFVIKLFGITDNFLKPINQIIKAISILLGVCFGLKTNKHNGLVTGVLIGLVYTIFAFVVFSALNGSFSFDKTILNDVLFGGITGAICGVICVNIGKRKTSWKTVNLFFNIEFLQN